MEVSTVLQTQRKGVPDNKGMLQPIAILFVSQTQQKGYLDNRGKSEPIAMLFVLQTQGKGYPDNLRRTRTRMRRRTAAARENMQPPTDVGEKTRPMASAAKVGFLMFYL